MDKKRNLKRTQRRNNKYRVVNRNYMKQFSVVKNSSDEEYMVDIERLRKALEKIEKEFYSSDIKLEQIEKKCHSKIVYDKMAEIFSPRKKLIKSKK